MAQYQTGTAASPTALKTIIEIFCTDNGFILSGGWLSKNQSHVSVTSSLPYDISGITRSGTIATCGITSNHNLITGDTVTISGATDSLYNGAFSVTVLNATQFTYVMAGTPSANATGTLVLSGHPTALSILGANSADGLTEPAPYSNCINVPLSSWPVTYYLFYSGTPDQVCCVVRHDVTKFQHIMFGEIVKVHDSAYVGGNWFWATRGKIDITRLTKLTGITDTALTGGTYAFSNLCTGSVVPFAAATQATKDALSGAIHAKVDSNIWGSGYTNSLVQGDVIYTMYTVRSLFRGPNTWNSQALLVPIHLEIGMASSLASYLGYIEHVRFIRIDNYEAGDIVTLGSDQWKVFPAVEKNSAIRNGENGATSHSGTIGFAIRYVP